MALESVAKACWAAEDMLREIQNITADRRR